MTAEARLDEPSTWTNIPVLDEAPCEMCGAKTKGRIAVENDGVAAMCSLGCELRFEGERSAVFSIAAYLDRWADDAEEIPGPPQYEDALRDAARAIRRRDWREHPEPMANESNSPDEGNE